MAKKETKTNAMRILDQAGVSYEIHTYDVSDDLIDGVSVARKCNEDPEQVFKTLVTVGNDKEHYVFVIPVAEKLDLKECAKAVGVKRFVETDRIYSWWMLSHWNEKEVCNGV